MLGLGIPNKQRVTWAAVHLTEELSPVEPVYANPVDSMSMPAQGPSSRMNRASAPRVNLGYGVERAGRRKGRLLDFYTFMWGSYGKNPSKRVPPTSLRLLRVLKQQ